MTKTFGRNWRVSIRGKIVSAADDPTDWIELILQLRGALQGVGFRPTMVREVEGACLSGSVQNAAGSVILTLQGPSLEVDGFVQSLSQRLPRAARLDSMTVLSRAQPVTQNHSKTCVISDSDVTGSPRMSIPADLAMCAECLREVRDPASRFYGYPFTTCTECGPRYTVVEAMPYDRERTSLRDFALCARCLGQYTDVRDRRFHAESIACPTCGPKLTIWRQNGQIIAITRADDETHDELKKVRFVRERLAAGDVVAVLAMGGFVLVADARNGRAIARLRARKTRPHKPFAVMARNVDVVASQCVLRDDEKALLASSVGPIVLLDCTDQCDLPMHLLNADSPTLGVMLPATPLQWMLAEPLKNDSISPFDFLVMTSGNLSGEPICTTNAEALARLAGIADFIIGHDREVRRRADDSVVRRAPVQMRSSAVILRRARGFAPQPILLQNPLKKTVLAMGAELKSTIAIGSDNEIVLSPHIGDLATPEAVEALLEASYALPNFLRRAPEFIAVDLHADMHSSRIGRELATTLKVPVFAVQHHHAHAAAVMAEHGLQNAIALVFDGTGFGADGTIWGGELLWVQGATCERLGTFEKATLLGGDAATRDPRRQIVARWLDMGLQIAPHWLSKLAITDQEWQVWQQQWKRKINCVFSHSVGRMFDSVAAAISVGGDISYEARAAIRLEALAQGATTGSPGQVSFRERVSDRLCTIDFAPFFVRLHDVPASQTPSQWALEFHQQLARASVRLARHGQQLAGVRELILAGGVMANSVLLSLLVAQLAGAGFVVYCAKNLPPNDGAISVGQAFIAGQIAT
jgi:hydrogenase maturation protein HypF